MPFFQARGVAPAAGFASTVEDLARFAQWQFRLLRGGATEVLKANTLREMYRVHWRRPRFRHHLGPGLLRHAGATARPSSATAAPARATGRSILLKPDESVANGVHVERPGRRLGALRPDGSTTSSPRRSPRRQGSRRARRRADPGAEDICRILRLDLRGRDRRRSSGRTDSASLWLPTMDPVRELTQAPEDGRRHVPPRPEGRGARRGGRLRDWDRRASDAPQVAQQLLPADRTGGYSGGRRRDDGVPPVRIDIGPDYARIPVL